MRRAGKHDHDGPSESVDEPEGPGAVADARLVRPLHWIALAAGCLALAWSWSWPSPQLVALLLGAAAVVAAWIGVLRAIRDQRRFSPSAGFFLAATLIAIVCLWSLLPLRLRVAVNAESLSGFSDAVTETQGVEVTGSCFRLIAGPGGTRWVVGVGNVAVPSAVPDQTAGSFDVGATVEAFECDGREGSRFTVARGLDNPLRSGEVGLMYAPDGLPPADDPLSVGSSYTYLYSGWYLWEF